jgi:hypothetical protein
MESGATLAAKPRSISSDIGVYGRMANNKAKRGISDKNRKKAVLAAKSEIYLLLNAAEKFWRNINIFFDFFIYTKKVTIHRNIYPIQPP